MRWSVEQIRRAVAAGDVQMHRLTPAPSSGGEDPEHDRIVAALAEFNDLDVKVQQEVREIFARHGLQDAGFLGYLNFACSKLSCGAR